ncbi:hypothetical protein Pmani_021356 [Petrolisthes manimaculis]|uniref:Uncharacterized protein n=1 Tax=Petrolisthes manimaculis TaxID=1843537 RepID=A0AAE1PGL7_9EUCA|nr:hypothetical protein Pmani_021356 [Petrolisthes manimaculis]
MIISKDVQDVLEGVHYFLSVTLRCERLGIAAEGERRGLVGRLEALTHTHPAISLSLPRNPSAASLPYLPMDTPPMLGVQQVHPSESSSGGSNSYSNSSNSGDGMVMAKGMGVLAGGASTLPASLRQQRQEELEEEEIYEEFDEPEDVPVVMARMEQQQQQQQMAVVEARREDLDDREDGEDVYMEAVEAIPFSNIIASCEKHGTVNKRTKGLLRNLKSYHIVAANGRLYLYLRDTDERQRKTIDLTGYTARSATGEDIRDQRKRDSAFEIVGPGKKTHTFVARTARDKQDWLEALERTLKMGRSQTNHTKISPFILTGSANTNLNTTKNIAPTQTGYQGKSHTLPASQGLGANPSEEYFYYHDVADDELDEVYEEINSEVTCDSLPPPPQSLLSVTPPPPPPPPHSLISSLPPPLPTHPAPSPVPPSHPPPPPPPEELPDYDPVCPENLVPPSVPFFLPKQTPPGRPPLPAMLQDRLNSQSSRPLPDAPTDHGEESDDSVGIYCEIEEDVLEMARENYRKALEAVHGSGDGKRTLTNGEVKQQQGSSQPPLLPARASGNSLVGFLSDEIFQNISNFGSTSPSRFPSGERPNVIKTPPKLPPKGVPPAAPDDDDSEYKVPISTTMDSEYQVPPSNPVPTDPASSGTSKPVTTISGPLQPSSQLYQVPPVQTIMSIKPSGKERRTSVVDAQAKPLSSFLTSKEDPYSKNKLKDQVQHFENPSDNKTNTEPRPSQGTSVKDMIAKLNKNKTTGKNQSLKIIEEKSSPSSNTSNNNTATESGKVEECGENVFPKPNELKPGKPFVPPRPTALINCSPEKQKSVSPMLEQQQQRDSGTGSETGVCTDDEHYETPEDMGLDFGPNTQGQVMSQRDTNIVPPDNNNSEEGDVYVAKFAFVATIDQALSFSRGDQLVILDTSGNSGWWRASFKGRQGVVPREYLKKKEEGKS